MNRDPVGFAGGLNVYEYSYSSPTSNVDHTGLGELGTLLAGVTTDHNTVKPMTWHELAEFASFGFEPLDWYLTAEDIYLNGPSWYHLLGLAPIIPGWIGRVLKKDKGDSARKTYGAFSDDINKFFVNPGGQSFSKGICGEGIRVSQKGYNLVKRHLTERMDYAIQNMTMLKRLKEAKDAGMRITGPDASFYLHEATEASLYNKGFSYDKAHRAALEKYDLHDLAVYPPDVIESHPDMFNSLWVQYWNNQ